MSLCLILIIVHRKESAHKYGCSFPFKLAFSLFASYTPFFFFVPNSFLPSSLPFLPFLPPSLPPFQHSYLYSVECSLLTPNPALPLHSGAAALLKTLTLSPSLAPKAASQQQQQQQRANSANKRLFWSGATPSSSTAPLRSAALAGPRTQPGRERVGVGLEFSRVKVLVMVP